MQRNASIKFVFFIKLFVAHPNIYSRFLNLTTMTPAPLATGDNTLCPNSSESGTKVKQSAMPSEVDMQFYYQRLLPFKYIFTWTSHSPKPTKDFTMREFAYEYRSTAYKRYNSYSNVDEFKRQSLVPTQRVSKLSCV